MTDQPGEARDLTQALEMYRDLDLRFGQVNALTHLGDVEASTGHPGTIRDPRQARDVFHRRGMRPEIE